MSAIPISVTEKQFREYLLPYLSTAQRGYVCKIPLHRVVNYILYRLHTGCQWQQLPILPDPGNPAKKELSPDAVAYHYRKWCRDGSWERVWQQSIVTVNAALDMTHVQFDGSHALAKKGGESVAYQHRKRAKTCNILPLVDGHGFVVATTGIIAGNHHDAFDLKPHLQAAFRSLKRLGIWLMGTLFNADSAFDTREARRVCGRYGVIPNIAENKRNRKTPKRGRPRRFNPLVYKQRFTSERTFAWIDKFRALLLRFERRDVYFLGGHYLAYALINLRHVFAAAQ